MAGIRNRWVAGIAVVVTCAVIGVLMQTLGFDRFEAWWGFAVTVPGLLFGVYRQMHPEPTAPASATTTAAKDWLRTAVTDQWTAEARKRGLSDVTPIELYWSQSTRDVLVSAPPSSAAAVRGALPELSRGITEGGYDRVVILGEPGAGKTTFSVLLLLRLLSEDVTAVPVLFSAAAWDPLSHDLADFVRRSLRETYPGLMAPQFGPNAGQELLGSGAILPIIDGLDELDPRRKSAALRHLRATRAPLILTCRSEEYEDLVRSNDLVVPVDIVIELQPIDPPAARDFILDGRPHSSVRWQKVIDAIAVDGSPAAQALSTPLMLSLVRTLYAGGSGLPDELVSPDRFPTARSLEDHLLDSYIASAYQDTPAQTPAGPEHRWLTELARYTQQYRTPNIAWWELHQSVGATTRRALRATVLATTCGGLLALATFWRGGVIAGVTLFVALTVSGRIRSRAGQFLLSIFLGAGLGLATATATAPALAVIFGTGAMLGGILMTLRVKEPGESALPRRVHSQALRTRENWRTILPFTLFTTACGILASSFTDGTTMIIVGIIGWAFGLFAIALAYIGRPVADGRGASGPAETLWGDRIWTLVFALGSSTFLACSTAVLGLTTLGREQPMAYWLRVGLLIAVAAAVALLLTVSASATYTWSVVIQAWRGRLPLRLMPFLVDAHRRGLLRQVGPVYQFRHRRVAERIASAPPTP
ncbi:hypothetical protein [Kineosporia sp. NBRC 101731]|uniref:NACHT domain-containing protein n=1 Tax=Kineosporia sp. NBRC 101731 TaxID=3032199 RepID=UPI0024A491FF|nr:hypothetical protein [Kineosporia sp. NBRC 101731]GLY31875.1 hypothetical protein Kisp02_52400 [Kineosporia sp. NBRC 101731]